MISKYKLLGTLCSFFLSRNLYAKRQMQLQQQGVSVESYESYDTVDSSESSKPEQILTSFESNQGEQTGWTLLQKLYLGFGFVHFFLAQYTKFSIPSSVLPVFYTKHKVS